MCQGLGAGPGIWLALSELTAVGIIVPMKRDLKQDALLRRHGDSRKDLKLLKCHH